MARPDPAARADPALVAEAEEILSHVTALRRELLRNPFVEAERSGLTAPQVTVMACLVSRGPMTLTELSRAVGLSHSTASGIVDRLQARELLRRTPDARDRRRTWITVTEMVTEYVHELEEGPSGRLAAALRRATAEQRRVIKEGLAMLRQLLAEAEDERHLPLQRAGQDAAADGVR
ncbi:MAG TPA: MarR family transcriptional regulator [Chloroflexota bacterium]|jgi:DNA-binding MarR family transcriptional regulator|nr:MarR family transcriptional regulator [Chloroflexota bacterium]